MSDGHLNDAKVGTLPHCLPSPVVPPDGRGASLVRDRDEAAVGVSTDGSTGTDDEPSIDLLGRCFPKLAVWIVLTDGDGDAEESRRIEFSLTCDVECVEIEMANDALVRVSAWHCRKATCTLRPAT
jgi:hypothetical protein